jgi:hypothetical protein
VRRRRSVGIVRVPVRNVWIRTATTFPRNTRLRTFTGRKNEGRACTHRDPSGERSPAGTTQCPCGCIRRSQSTDAKDMPDVQPPEAVSLSCATIRFQTGCSSGHNSTLATITQWFLEPPGCKRERSGQTRKNCAESRFGLTAATLERLARRTGRFAQLVDPRSSVNGLLLTGSPRFREVSLEERRSLAGSSSPRPLTPNLVDG